MAPHLRLHTFGGPWIEGPSGPLTQVAPQRRRLALLALVAASGPAGISRDRTVALLWPDSEPAKARRSLAQLLYGMRHSLEAVPILSEGDLRLDPAVMTSDVGDFLAAASDGNEAAVAQLGLAPFLDGFYLDDAPEFSRWAEEQRETMRQRVAQAELALARAAEARGAPGEGVERWRRLSALAPLDARPALGLMRALAAAGDRNAAMQAARAYEARVRAELGVEPDREVRSLAARLARELVATPQGSSPPRPSPIATTPPIAPPPATTAPLPRPRRRALIAIGALTILLAVGAFVIRQRRPHGLLAVGTIRYAGVDSNSTAAILSDMLATSLARLSGVQVLSTARILEIRSQLRAEGDADTSLSIAAARAGAGELLEGMVHRIPGAGRLQLDMRRVDLASGAVRGSYRLEADDIYQLADDITAQIASDMALPVPQGTIAGVTTSSLVAYRFYIEGLTARENADAAGALRLFQAALEEDSTFAMAAYMAWLASGDLEGVIKPSTEYRDRMMRLASRATDHDRLLILGDAAVNGFDPSAIAYSDSLSFRYPRDVNAQTVIWRILMSSGDYEGALAAIRKVISLEGTESARNTHPCVICEAYAGEIAVLRHLGRMDEALKVAEVWNAEAPGTLSGMIYLADEYDREFQTDASLDLLRRVNMATGGHPPLGALAPAMALERAGRFDDVRTLLLTHIPTPGDDQGPWTWYYWTDLRNRGRFEDAYHLVLQGHAPGVPSTAPLRPGHTAEALVMFEAGKARDAIRRLDTLTVRHYNLQGAGVQHFGVWAKTHLAYYLWAQGDTARLAALADTVEEIGTHTLFFRDRVLHHFIRGLLSAARGRDAEAIASYRNAISSWPDGYSRINYELARAYLRIGQPAQAIAPLQMSLRGVFDASCLYMTHTELHETLAKVFDAAGQRDSAAAQFRWVARAWKDGDPPFQARAAQAAERARELDDLLKSGTPSSR